MKTICAICAVAAVCGVGCSYVNDILDQKDDWVGEEFIEAQIENQLGLADDSLDLTPGTPEE